MNTSTKNNTETNSDAHQKACEKRTINDVIVALPTVRPFLNAGQLACMADGCRGEEKEFFKDKFFELFQTIRTMPRTYDTDGQGDQAVAHLHYFKNDTDYYITELDREREQHQAFGLACMWEEELGYISIVELIQNGFELDLHFDPQTLSQIMQKREVEAAMTDPNSVCHPMHY